jgi:hypothetical protein
MAQYPLDVYKEKRQQEFEAFKSELADVLNWETTLYSTGKVIIHT